MYQPGVNDSILAQNYGRVIIRLLKSEHALSAAAVRTEHRSL